jgi:gamma-glutamyl-gamma-aminobutyrate hydrolase PuuD
MKRIGLTQRVDVVPSYGERRDGLDQKWAGLLLTLGFCPVPLANKVQEVEGYLAALSLDGVVLTGGNDLVEAEGGSEVAPERDRFEHLLLDLFTAERLPVLGVCRGLQLMNVHYGGALKRVAHHVAQRHLTAMDPGFFPGCTNSILVNSFHQFAIDQPGQSAQLKAIAWAEDGTIEAAAHESLPQFGVMWHPEREGSLAKHDMLLIRAAFGEGRS